MTEGEEGGAGNWSLKGFDYQVDVSVWLALDLMVAAKMTSEMTLEHVSEEDLEADIEDFEPGPVADSVPMHGYRLIVQSKRRSGDAWTTTGFINLLNHGERRKSAKVRLAEDLSARYLLVTSAAINGPLRSLNVRRAGSWPAATKVPDNIAGVAKGIAGRLAIVGSADDERLVRDIRDLLVDSFRVPNARWGDCHTALRTEAWKRMRGEAKGRWTRDDVRRIIVAYDGYLADGSEVDTFVRPTNWGDIRQALDSRHAIIIIGQSGSGKTATSEALWRDLREEVPGLQRIHITHGPEQLRADKTLPPVLYDIEDPWGRFKFEPESRPWNDQLEGIFRQARHDRLLVATSRLDVALGSGALDSVARWRVPLDAENYGPREKQRLFRNLVRTLPEDLAALAHEREVSVLKQFELPLEIRKFFDALPEINRQDFNKNPDTAFAGAVAHAHRDSIERTVIQQVEAREAVKAAAIIWALIKPHGRLSADLLRSIEDPLGDADADLEEGISQFVVSFVSARNLRQGADGSLTYYHGKVEAGIETVLGRQPRIVRRALRTLIDVLVAHDDDTGGSWGVETSAEIIRLSDRIDGARPQVTRSSQDRIDRWVEEQLQSTGRELDRRIMLAAAAGSPRSNLAELARWLAHRPDRGFPGLMDWGEPSRDDAWRARMRQDPAARSVLEAFVRTVLPSDQTGFPKNFPKKAARLAGDLSDAFLDAAKTSVQYGIIRNGDMIAEAALADLDGFEDVVNMAVEILTPTEKERERWARRRMMIDNEECSDDYAEHLADDDDGYTAREYLKAFAAKLRIERGWQAIAQHRQVKSLRAHWLRLLMDEEKVEATEVRGAFEAGHGSEDEEIVWEIVTRHWRSDFERPLLARLTEGHPDEGVRVAALDCLLDHRPASFQNIVIQLAEHARTARLPQLALDLAHCATNGRRDDKQRRRTAAASMEQLPEAYRQFAKAIVALNNDKAPLMSDAALKVVGAVADVPNDFRAERVRLACHLDIDVSTDINWFLAKSDSKNDALNAIEAAIRHGLTEEIESALDHKFAHVAARALTTIAEPLRSPLPQLILDCAARESSPVRKALVAQLKAKPHEKHLSALLVLVTDEWSKRASRGEDDGHYPIARDAAETLLELASVPDDTLAQLIDLAKRTDDTSLMPRLLSAVLRHGDEKRHAQILEMSRRGPRLSVGNAAASALLQQHERLSDVTVALISTKMLTRLPASIADYLVLVVGLRGSEEAVTAAAEALAASDDRRIFLALLAGALRDRDVERAVAVAALLPVGHPAREWAEGSEAPVDRDSLIDLGDASAVKEAYHWMPHPQKHTRRR